MKCTSELRCFQVTTLLQDNNPITLRGSSLHMSSKMVTLLRKINISIVSPNHLFLLTVVRTVSDSPFILEKYWVCLILALGIMLDMKVSMFYHTYLLFMFLFIKSSPFPFCTLTLESQFYPVVPHLAFEETYCMFLVAYHLLYCNH